jgi:hypothetical protein
VPADVLLAAAARAPAAPGAYFFVGPDHDLLYVGKAANLRRRLRNHARAPRAVDRRSDARIARVRVVAWEECACERDALLREADLIVALRPPYNASHTTGPAATYLRVEAGEATTFRLVTTADGGAGPAGPDGPAGRGGAGGGRARARVYGPFPHLAKGGHSSPAKWTKRGCTALLRALWAAQRSPQAARIPRAIAGASPPMTATVPVDVRFLPRLHRFLAGQGDRLIGDLRAALSHGHAPAYMHARLDADVEAASDFYALGPRRLAQFRHRHGLAPGPVRPEVATRLLLGEVRVTVGDPLLSVPPSPRGGRSGLTPEVP